MASSPNTEDVGTIFFWHDDEVPYGFFSQWYSSAFTSPSSPDVVFNTAEQYMMYQKALLLSEEATAAKILNVASPAKQKKLGREVKGFDAETWDKKKERIVEDGNWCKFMHSKAGTELRKNLLNTGERELVEASPGDRIWGIGFSAASAEVNRENWRDNLLGKALMKVREKLAEQQRDKSEE
ncbi:MAG: hypothetical protein M1830_001778 [Pleopsidium flavum]|nr:MAG: hypothetical protein M1830_001778 [Pleopsidium flavum]